MTLSEGACAELLNLVSVAVYCSSTRPEAQQWPSHAIPYVATSATYTMSSYVASHIMLSVDAN